MNQAVFIVIGTTVSVVLYAAVQQVERRRSVVRFASAFHCFDQVESSQLSIIRDTIDKYRISSFFSVLMNPPPFHLERVFADIDFDYDRLENLSDDFMRENKEYVKMRMRMRSIETNYNSFEKQLCRDDGRWYEK